jgi:hypothetical protein
MLAHAAKMHAICIPLANRLQFQSQTNQSILFTTVTCNQGNQITLLAGNLNPLRSETPPHNHTISKNEAPQRYALAMDACPPRRPPLNRISSSKRTGLSSEKIIRLATLDRAECNQILPLPTLLAVHHIAAC